MIDPSAELRGKAREIALTVTTLPEGSLRWLCTCVLSGVLR